MAYTRSHDATYTEATSTYALGNKSFRAKRLPEVLKEWDDAARERPWQSF
jgi:hypothetical protein